MSATPRPRPGPALSERERLSLHQIETRLRRDRGLRASYDAYARYGSAMPRRRPLLRRVVRALRCLAVGLVAAALVAIAVGTVAGPRDVGLACGLLLITTGPLLLLAGLVLCPEVD